jgi:hypothetical protein
MNAASADMNEKPGDPLTPTLFADLEGLPQSFLQRLAALRIISAEELLSLSATADHRRRLAIYLGLSQEEFAALLVTVREQLGPDPKPEDRQQPQETVEENAMPGKSLKRLSPQPLSSGQLNELRKLNITTVEDLLSASALAKSRGLLATYLDISGRQLSSLLNKVQKQIDPSVAKEMRKPSAGGTRGGVLDPIPEGKRRGRRR